MVGVIFHSEVSPDYGPDTATGPLISSQVRCSWALLENVEEMLALFGRKA